MEHQNILATTEGAVGIITLNRPKALNALNNELLGELCAQLEAWDRDDAVHCTVLTGSDRARAATHAAASRAARGRPTGAPRRT